MNVEVLSMLSEDNSILLLVRLIATESIAETAETAEQKKPRRPVNLCLVIDRSSSMRGPRLKQAVQAARELIGNLGPKDRLSIVSFDAAPTILCPPGPVTDARRREMEEALASMTTGVGTNLAAALRKGAEQIRSSFVRNSISRVLLLTDGQASVGITDRDRLGAICEAIFKAGVTITTMGLGQGFDDELLIDMAVHGHGSYYYLASPEDIPVAFGRELQGVFSIAAQDTILKLIPHDAIESLEILHALPSQPISNGLQVEIGDVSSEIPRQVLFRMQLETGSECTSAGRITVTYNDADGMSRDANMQGIPLQKVISTETRQVIIAEELGLRVANAVDQAWARRTSGSSGHALLALREIHSVVTGAKQTGRCAIRVADALLHELAQAEIAINEGAAERENARREMRERSQLTQLGHSVLYTLDDT